MCWWSMSRSLINMTKYKHNRFICSSSPEDMTEGYARIIADPYGPNSKLFQLSIFNTIEEAIALKNKIQKICEDEDKIPWRDMCQSWTYPIKYIYHYTIEIVQENITCTNTVEFVERIT